MPTKQQINPILICLILLFTIPFWFFKKEFIPINFTLFLGLIFIPFIFQKTENSSSFRYFIPAMLLAIILIFYQSSTAYFFFFGLCILFILENFLGKFNQLPLFLFVVISPLFQHLTSIWSFPIRLELSKLTGLVISKLGWRTEIVGNIIYLNNEPFSVDPACMGLKMISTSLLIGLIILAYFERKRQCHFQFFEITTGLGIIGFLAVLSNFTRLLILVIFQIMPDNFMHDVLGILSLVIYVVLPFYFLVKYFSAAKKTQLQTPSEIHSKRTIHLSLKNYYLTAILFFFLILNGNQFLKKNTTSPPEFTNFEYPNFQKSITGNNILKLENDSLLIYIKPPIKPFQGSHDPRICWQGSGYTFSNIEIKAINGIEVYTALLTHKKEVLHTAWWFDNGRQQTIGEWKWRWQMLQGAEGFRLVNISSFDETTLREHVSKFLKISF